ATAPPARSSPTSRDRPLPALPFCSARSRRTPGSRTTERCDAGAVTAFRLFLHILAASVWVGGQIVMAGILPTTRRLEPESRVAVATAFGRVAWIGLAVAVLTGLWNVMAIPMDELPHPWVELHLLAVLVTAAGAFLHTIARGRPALLAVGGATAALGAIAAMYLGVLVTTNVA